MDHPNGRTGPLTLERGIRSAADLRVKVFADGADLVSCRALYADPRIEGFTTNPTLMHKAGVRDYEAFARELVAAIPDRPISFEVFSDDFAEMESQARTIAAWGSQVYVKIPVTNCDGERSDDVLRRLAADGVKVNCTGLMTVEQVRWVAEAMAGGTPGCVSVFAGRIADTGVDPVPIMRSALDVLSAHDALELIWASPREVLNIVQADAIGCDIITVTHDLLKKLSLLGKDLDAFSLETVRMFRDDAHAAGLTL
jgi:transaldolase